MHWFTLKQKNVWEVCFCTCMCHVVFQSGLTRIIPLRNLLAPSWPAGTAICWCETLSQMTYEVLSFYRSAKLQLVFFFVGIKAIVQIRCTIPVFTWALAFLSHVCTVETLPIFFKMEVGLASYLQQLRRKTTAISQFGEEIFLN